MRIVLAIIAVSMMGETVTGQQTRPRKVCLVSGSLEYDSDTSLAVLQKYLEKNYPIQCTRAFRKDDKNIPGLDNLDTCDVMVLFTRRLAPAPDQLERIKKYCTSGKPIVGIRTASHAFQNWLDLDREILGGNYKGHYGAGTDKIDVGKGAQKHPILRNVKLTKSAGSLYKNSGLVKDVDILLYGSNDKHTEPIAWTRVVHGGRVFYTSLGHQEDFRDENFLRLIANAILWTTKAASAPE